MIFPNALLIQIRAYGTSLFSIAAPNWQQRKGEAVIRATGCNLFTTADSDQNNE